MKEPAYIRRLKARGIRVSPDGKVSARAADRALEKLQDEYWDVAADLSMLQDHLNPESRPDGVPFE